MEEKYIHNDEQEEYEIQMLLQSVFQVYKSRKRSDYIKIFRLVRSDLYDIIGRSDFPRIRVLADTVMTIMDNLVEYNSTLKHPDRTF